MRERVMAGSERGHLPLLMGTAAFLFLIALILPLPESYGRTVSKNSCFNCHIQLGGRMKDTATGWKESIHAEVGVTCEMCHGGNPYITTEDSMNVDYGFAGVPSIPEIPELCASCHSDVSQMRQYNQRTDQYDEYKTSQHGILLARGDKNVATCVSCHGAHEIRKKNDPRSMVFHTNVPETCDRCHGDEKLMEGYGIPHDQFEEYKNGAHGKKLYDQSEGNNPLVVPSCATCHGIHGATPPGISEISNVCGNCHSNIYRYYQAGPHARAVAETGEPRCVDCHGNHINVHPDVDLFTGDEAGKCGFCHEMEGEEYLEGQKIKEKMSNLKELVRGMSKGAAKAKESGRDIERLKNAVEFLRVKYIQLIPMTHAVDLGILRPMLTDAEDQAKIAKEEFGKIEEEFSHRKRIAYSGAGLLLALALLLTIKLNRAGKGK